MRNPTPLLARARPGGLIWGGKDAGDVYQDLRKMALAFLKQAYSDMDEYGGDAIRCKLHCDELDYTGSKPARRPFSAQANYVSASVEYVVDTLMLAWLLGILGDCK
ncbi:hypothetical protein A4X13_0g7257, partial [Tilletia indica]